MLLTIYAKSARDIIPAKVLKKEVVPTRARTRLSQGQFAAALSISARTLQHWEQGRRQPSGAAAALLKIIARHPELLLETLARR